MSELQPSHIQSWVNDGYKFLLYHNMEHFALITPLMEVVPTNESTYTIPIDDDQAYEMAMGVNEFYFYVLS
ncbi:MAG TPA: hypothetical protein VIT44_07650 [Cyclobacteriaceae bacterium]